MGRTVSRQASALDGRVTWIPGVVQWVVKVSKRCNLRCTYCYEFPFLADRTRMTADQLERMFTNVAEYYQGTGRRMDFVWHGGEPLLLPPSFYEEIGEQQQRILGGAGVPFTNAVQTNLTVLRPDVLHLLKGFFTNIGVSIDLFGDHRVTASGRKVEGVVMEKMQRLIDERISFGCITVLSKSTAPHIDAIYSFFEDLDISFRLLPIYRTGYPGQQDTLALDHREIVVAFKKVVDRWFASDSGIQVRPIVDYVVHVLRYLDGGAGRRRCYNRLDAEVVYIVDTDGSLYSNADAYDPRLCQGNIFAQSISNMQSSVSYRRSVRAAHDRMGRTCTTCRYYGACSGYFVGEATPEQRWRDGEGQLICGLARPVQRYIEDILVAQDLVDRNEGLLRADRIRQKLESAKAVSFVG